MFELVLVYKVICNKLIGTQFGLDEDKIPIQQKIFAKKWEKVKEFQKFKKIAKIIWGEIVVLEEGSRCWSCSMTHKPYRLK